MKSNQWLIVSSTIIRSWKNTAKKGVINSPVFAFIPLLLISLVTYYMWSNYSFLVKYFEVGFSTATRSHDILAKSGVIVFFLTAITTIFLYQISGPKRDFFKLLSALPITRGDIIFGYSLPFITVITIFIFINIAPIITALIAVLGFKITSIFILVGLLLTIVAIICAVLLLWNIIDFIVAIIIGENGSEVIKLVFPMIVLFIPLFSIIITGKLTTFVRLFSDTPFLPIYWLINLFENDTNIFYVLESFAVLVGFFLLALFFWWAYSRATWHSGYETSRGLRFLKRIPFFSKKPVVNMALIEMKQTVRDAESLAFLIISFIMFLAIIAVTYFKGGANSSNLIRLIIMGFSLMVILLGSFAITSRARDSQSSWFFSSIPLSFNGYVNGKWLGNILIILPLFLVMASIIMSIAGYALRDLLMGIFVFSIQLLLYTTVGFLSGILFRIKKNNAIDQLIAVFVFALLVLLVITFMQYTVNILATIWPAVNFDLIGIVVNIVLIVCLLSLASITESLRRAS